MDLQPEVVSYTFGLPDAAECTQLRDAGIATVATVNSGPPGATLPVSLLFEIARSVRGVIVLDDAIVAPVGDLVPAPGEIIKTTLDLVTEA